MIIFEKKKYPLYIDRLANLFEKSFKKRIDKNYLNWRYVKNPVRELLVNVEINNEDVIANYSASPVVMSIYGENVKTALSMTTMTDPMHMGKGLFPKLATELYEHMEDNDYSLIWGFPNNNSHRGFVNKLKWNDVYEIPTMKLIVSNENKLNDFYETDNQFNLDYKEVVPIEKGIFVKKDKEYLKWRYHLNPINKYTNLVVRDIDSVSSFCVIKVYNESLDIIDFQPRNIDEGQKLLNQVVAFAHQKNLTTINCWAPRHHFTHQLYEKLGFFNSSPITYLGFKNFKKDSSSEYLVNYNNWYIQMGDSDVY